MKYNRVIARLRIRIRDGARLPNIPASGFRFYGQVLWSEFGLVLVLLLLLVLGLILGLGLVLGFRVMKINDTGSFGCLSRFGLRLGLR